MRIIYTQRKFENYFIKVIFPASKKRRHFVGIQVNCPKFGESTVLIKLPAFSISPKRKYIILKEEDFLVVFLTLLNFFVRYIEQERWKTEEGEDADSPLLEEENSLGNFFSTDFRRVHTWHQYKKKTFLYRLIFRFQVIA